MQLHPDELTIDEPLVRRLVEDQLPSHTGTPLTRLEASGSTNALFRLGTGLLVRVPRQPGGSATILKEARWLSEMAVALPCAVPEVISVGRPAHGYPERWSVVAWLDGRHPEPGNAADQDGLARDLAGVIAALRAAEVPQEAAVDPALRWYRAEPLTGLDESFRADVAACRSLPGLRLDLDAALAVWEEAMVIASTRQDVRRHWVHADLLAENLLVADDRLTAVLDFGALCVGDPAVDLAVAWELLDAPARQTFRDVLAVDEGEWLLGRAWALAIALMTFAYYWRTMPGRCGSRMVMARNVLTDATTAG